MVDPRILCRKHLLGEHVETHMFRGTLKKGIRIQGYIQNNLFEPASLYERHEALATELLSRGYIHSSPFINDVPIKDGSARINRTNSLDELLSRCPECKRRFEELQ